MPTTTPRVPSVTSSQPTYPTATSSSSESQTTNQSFVDVESDEKLQPSKAWIAGAVAGPVGAVALLGMLLFIFYRRKQKRASANKAIPNPPLPKTLPEYYPPPPKVELSGSRPHKEKKKTTTTTIPELVGSSVIPMIPAVELEGNPTRPVINEPRT